MAHKVQFWLLISNFSFFCCFLQLIFAKQSKYLYFIFILNRSSLFCYALALVLPLLSPCNARLFSAPFRSAWMQAKNVCWMWGECRLNVVWMSKYCRQNVGRMLSECGILWKNGLLKAFLERHFVKCRFIIIAFCGWFFVLISVDRIFQLVTVDPFATGCRRALQKGFQ